MNPQKLVCFDLGGVLVKVAANWNEALAQAGVSAERIPAETVGLSEVAGFDEYQAGTWTEDAYLTSLADRFGLSAVEALSAHQSILVGEYDGALEVVNELNQLGIRTSCLSNTNDLHWQRLLDAAYHPAVVALGQPLASHELGLAKPDPQIYRAAEAALGGTPVFFDDNLANVEAARSVGWKAYQTDPKGDPPALIRQVLIELGYLKASCSV